MNDYLSGFGWVYGTNFPATGQAIALYGIPAEPRHVALRVEDGWWESKLGNEQRVLHRLEELGGGYYGNVLGFYWR